MHVLEANGEQTFLDGFPEGHKAWSVVGPKGPEQWVGSVRGEWNLPDGYRLIREELSCIDERAEQVRQLRADLDSLVLPMLRAGELTQPSGTCSGVKL
jgi:hypothetical protein